MEFQESESAEMHKVQVSSTQDTQISSQTGQFTEGHVGWLKTEKQ